MNKRNSRVLSLIMFAGFITVFSIRAEKYVVGQGLKSETETETGSDSDTLVVKARLIEIPGTFPPNDLYDYVYVMKYRVLSVEKGEYDSRNILVGQYNPLIPRDKINDDMKESVRGNVKEFREGDKHILQLIEPITTVWQDAVEDEYFESELVKYYAVETRYSESD
ncbi:MAG: hypothetical protein ACOCSE_06455 [Chitinivibrionales bacterium]